MPGPGPAAAQTDADYTAVAYTDLSASQVMDIYLPENLTGPTRSSCCSVAAGLPSATSGWN